MSSPGTRRATVASGGSVASVAVIGAGVAGLTCAIELATRGVAVTVFEAHDHVGGKIRQVELSGQKVDAGPTVLTMRWVFEELFTRAGRQLDDYLTTERAQVLARHAWPDGSTLDLFAEEARTAEAIAAFSGPDDARAYKRFAAHTRAIYAAVEAPFVRAQRPTLWALMRHAGDVGLTTFANVDAHRTMWRALEGTFRDVRLRQLFGRYATYSGSSPFEAPATLNLIAHVESLGVFRVRGGMGAVAGALERLARELGVEFRFGSPVASIVVRRGAAAGIVLEGGEEFPADAVVANTDIAALATGLLGDGARTAIPPDGVGPRSLSAVTWALVGRASGFPLLHHNVFFSADYPAEFRALRGARELPKEPTIYVCAQDRGDDAVAHASERVLMIANAPATGDDATRWGEEERQACETSAWATMNRCGLQLAVEASQMTTPREFHQLFPGTGGALYGASAQGPLSALSRPGARTKLPRLYLAGGSVHPGAGVPMAAISGRLAAATVLPDLPSTTLSRPAATSGSTSTA